MTLSEELVWRGFVHQTTMPDLKVLDQHKVSFYHGFDASADSQTVGNLAGMMMDRLFMRHGHKAVILAGGATSLIGDPGGKDSERPLQDEQTIAHNISKAEGELKKVFSSYDFKLVNNLDWTRDLSVVKFLRDIGKHFSMTPIIQRDYIARRLGEGGSGISYAEFSYTILQGMDYLHLFDSEGVSLQLGGSDQWGNILSGIELVRRVRGQEVHAITSPLIIDKTTGIKFGKSEAGAVWLDPQKTLPNDFYQFWLNSSDESVENYLKIFTELSHDETEQLIKEHRANPAQRLAQKKLAMEVTKLVHSKEVAMDAQQKAADLRGVTQADITADIKLSAGTSLIEALVKSGLATSNTEARRLIENEGVYINDQPTKQDVLAATDFLDGKLRLRRGKKFMNSVIIELSEHGSS